MPWYRVAVSFSPIKSSNEIAMASEQSRIGSYTQGTSLQRARLPSQPETDWKIKNCKMCPTCKREFMPRLPVDILKIIFDSIDASEDSPFALQKRWVILSLVCKEWRKVIVPYRRTITLPTTQAIQSFVIHAPTLTASGIAVRHLTYQIADLSEKTLLEVFSPLSRTLKSLTMSLHHLRTLHSSSLVGDDGCNIEKICLLHDDRSYRNLGVDCSGDIQEFAHILLSTISSSIWHCLVGRG